MPAPGFRAAGPLGRLVDAAHWVRAKPGANLLVILRRLAPAPSAGVAMKDAKEAVLDAATSRPAFGGALLNAAIARRRAAIEDLGYTRAVATLTVNCVSPLAIGLSAETPLEVGLTLHGTYGCPVLPGSALKGVAARAAAETPGWDERRRLQAFGGSGTDPADPRDRRGRAMVLDALPTAPITLVRDVLTPHVQPYYANPTTQPPAEYWAPVPVGFLTVPPGATFTIHIVGAGGDDAGAVDDLRAVIARGLVDLGLGAKTAAGYGEMAVIGADEGDG